MDLCTGVTVGRDVSSLRSGECLRLSEQAMEWFHQQLRGYQSSVKRLCLSLGPPPPHTFPVSTFALLGLGQPASLACGSGP